MERVILKPNRFFYLGNSNVPLRKFLIAYKRWKKHSWKVLLSLRYPSNIFPSLSTRWLTLPHPPPGALSLAFLSCQWRLGVWASGAILREVFVGSAAATNVHQGRTSVPFRRLPFPLCEIDLPKALCKLILFSFFCGWNLILFGSDPIISV